MRYPLLSFEKKELNRYLKLLPRQVKMERNVFACLTDRKRVYSKYNSLDWLAYEIFSSGRHPERWKNGEISSRTWRRHGFWHMEQTARATKMCFPLYELLKCVFFPILITCIVVVGFFFLLITCLSSAVIMLSLLSWLSLFFVVFVVFVPGFLSFVVFVLSFTLWVTLRRDLFF